MYHHVRETDRRTVGDGFMFHECGDDSYIEQLPESPDELNEGLRRMHPNLFYQEYEYIRERDEVKELLHECGYKAFGGRVKEEKR